MPNPAPQDPAGEPRRRSAPFRFGAVILAAGASARMGTPKQLLLVNGKPLLVHAVEAALASPAWPVVVVLGANAEQIQPVLARAPVITVENPTWPEGMASSIRAGVTALEQFSRQLDAGLVAVCDQPAFSKVTIAQLLAAYRSSGQPIAAASYAGHLGVPALFGREYFPALAALTGEQGARALLNGDDVATVELPELGFDIDTVADLAAYTARLGSPP